MLDWLHWQSDTSGGGLDQPVPADRVNFLAGMPTYAELLGDLGYDTCLSGKWHLGDGITPRAGFQTWNPMPYGATNYFTVPVVEDGALTRHEGSYASDLFTENALGFLARQVDVDRPFCLAVHYTAPHRPWGRQHHPAPIWDSYYRNCPFESVPGPDEPLPAGFQAAPVSAEQRRRNLAGYFASLEGMDLNLARLLRWLEAQDLRSNTLIVFMSDNGMNMGHHGLFGKGNATWPQNMFDTSVKVPCLISRPGHVPEGAVDTHLLSQYDWLPTLMEYVDAADRIPEGLPGQSFASLLAGRCIAERERIYVFDEYGPVRMIRSAEWKLIWRYPAGAHELYNVAEDPEERVNLFSRPGRADLIRTMRRELDDWFASYVDPQFDGAKLPVTGRGQRDHATKDGPFAYRMPWND